MDNTFIGIDIGGTLAKICFTQKQSELKIPDIESLRSNVLN